MLGRWNEHCRSSKAFASEHTAMPSRSMIERDHALKLAQALMRVLVAKLSSCMHLQDEDVMKKD